jgi:hypothetical protein
VDGNIGNKPGKLRWNAGSQTPELADVGSLIVRSKKMGKVRLDDGKWYALEAGHKLHWKVLPVGEHRVEVMVKGNSWSKTVIVRDAQISEVVAFWPGVEI